MKSSDLGSAIISPEGSFTAGMTGTWKLLYTVGKYGIDDGGSIIITRRAMSDAVPPQCIEPDQPGYTTASTDGDAQLKARYDNRYWIRPYRGAIVLQVFDGSLACGDTITVLIGDTEGGSPGWTIQTFPETRHTFKVLVDAFGTREYYPISKQPFITIVPGSPHSVEAVIPTKVLPHEDVLVYVRITDTWGNPVNDFTREVRLQCRDNGFDFDRTVSISRGVESPCSVPFPKE